MVGAKLVFPGAALDGPSLCELFESEGVTWRSACRPYGSASSRRWRRAASRSKLARLLVGGSAAPRAMIETFEKKYGITVMHGWGMTEMSPVGTLSTMKGKHRELPLDDRSRSRPPRGGRCTASR